MAAQPMKLPVTRYGFCMQRYVTKDERLPGIPEPKALEVPEEFKGNPHKFIAQLNSGALPYQLAGEPCTFISFSKPVNTCLPIPLCPCWHSGMCLANSTSKQL